MSNRESTSLLKTCSNCGQIKPLSAFLEMNSDQGTTYGNICSSCRKTALDELQRRKKTDAEGGSTTTEIGHKIDTKAKVQGEIDKREHAQRIDDEYHAERKDTAEGNEATKQTNQIVDTGQRRHREDFLKRRPFLGSSANQSGKPSAAQQLRTEMLRGNEQAAQQSDNAAANKLATGIDPNAAEKGQRVAGQERFKGQSWQQFLQWLGNSAPIVNNQNQTKKDPEPKKSGAITQNVTKTTTKPKHEEKAPDPAVEFIKDNWRPGSKR